MPVRLDSGHDEPIFGPGANFDIEAHLKRARTLVARYRRDAARIRKAAGRLLAFRKKARRGRRARYR